MERRPKNAEEASKNIRIHGQIPVLLLKRMSKMLRVSRRTSKNGIEFRRRSTEFLRSPVMSRYELHLPCYYSLFLFSARRLYENKIAMYFLISRGRPSTTSRVFSTTDDTLIKYKGTACLTSHTPFFVSLLQSHRVGFQVWRAHSR